jgi:protein disulfide-isomerase
MKKIILSFAFLLCGILAQAQDLTWHTDMNKATDLSIKEKKPLLLFFTGSDWCGWCIKLQKDVLKTEDFKKWAPENVILVELDFPRSKPMDDKLKMQNAQLQQTFQVRGFPTVWLVTPTKDKDNKITLNGLGSLGYDSSASNWIANATKFIPAKEVATKKSK